MAEVAKFAYALNDDVTVVPLKLPGRVIGQERRTYAEPRYEVVWWADSKRSIEWLFAHELERVR